MIDARLRRLCEKKPSGKVNVPDSVHQQWMAGGAKRDELRKLFEQYECDKDCIYQVTFFNWGVGDNYTCFCMHPWRQEMPSHMSNSYNMHIQKTEPACGKYPKYPPKFCDHLQEVFVSKVVKMIEHRKENSQEILCGWFTPEQMKTELKWDKTLVFSGGYKLDSCKLCICDRGEVAIYRSIDIVKLCMRIHQLKKTCVN